MKAKRVAIYARVSTDGQSTANQVRELEAWAERVGHTVVATYVDQGISGAKGREQRAQFDKLLKAAARRDFDIIAAWSVDRLGRSLRDLLAFLEEIHGAKVDLFLHQQGLDTSSPAGRAMFQLLGVFAEFERAMICERVRSGMRRARKEGTKSGRPFGRPKVGMEVERQVRALRRKGKGMLAIAGQLGIGSGTVQRILA